MTGEEYFKFLGDLIRCKDHILFKQNVDANNDKFNIDVRDTENSNFSFNLVIFQIKLRDILRKSFNLNVISNLFRTYKKNIFDFLKTDLNVIKDIITSNPAKEEEYRKYYLDKLVEDNNLIIKYEYVGSSQKKKISLFFNEEQDVKYPGGIIGFDKGKELR